LPKKVGAADLVARYPVLIWLVTVALKGGQKHCIRDTLRFSDYLRAAFQKNK
jgi:hypothetical protein